MQLTLSDEEQALLVELLDADFRELKEELGKTERYEYQMELRARQRLLAQLLERLQGSTTG